MTVRLLAILSWVFLFGCSKATQPSFDTQKGESIAFIGNTFAEQMYRYGFFETALHSKFPNHQLRVRNLGWSADEIDLRPRPQGFGTIHDQLAEQKADTVFACFGLNESFDGEQGLPRFKRQLTEFLNDLLGHQYNGATRPRIVLVSPCAHETNTAHNTTLRQYADTMAAVANELSIRFVDLLTPTLAHLATAGSKPLTHNGIHLTQLGYWSVSKMMAKALGLTPKSGTQQTNSDTKATSLRRAIVDKNRAFYLLWHGPNMEYVHGRRNRLPGAEGLTAERSRLTKIIADLDAQIAAANKPELTSLWTSKPAALPMWVTPPSYAGLQQTTAVKEPEVPAQHRIAKAAEAVNEFIPAEGFAVNLFASEENAPIPNPVAMQFDAEGRLWVACSKTWPHPTPGQQPSDSIVILEDTNQDGKADRHTVFIDHLPMIHGFALGNGGAYISQTPDLIFAADTNGDGRADHFQPILHGFGSEDVEHSINNLRWGPDGALYFMEGIFHHTQVETPYGPRRVRDGGVFRFEPRTHRFDVLASYAFWNPWGQTFDETGQHIVLDASSHDYFAASTLSAPYRYPKSKRNQHSELSFAPAGLGPAAGIELISSRHFPDEVQGRLLANQLSAGFRGTRWFDLSNRGSSFTAKQLETPLVLSTDNKCRLLGMSFAPDGSLYLLDFASGLIENTSESKRDPGRDHSHGRVWRMTYPSRPLQKPAKIVGASPAELLALLSTSDLATRRLARQALQEGDPDTNANAVSKWLEAIPATSTTVEQSTLEALWIQQGLDRVQQPLLKRVLAAKSAAVRAAGLRTLRFLPRSEAFDSELAKLINDPDPKVRLEAVLVCGAQRSARAYGLALLSTKHPADLGMQQVLGETLAYLETYQTTSNLVLPKDPQALTFLISRMSNHELVQLASKTPSAAVFTQITTRPLIDKALRLKACKNLAEIHKTSLAAQIHQALLRTTSLPDPSSQVELASMLAASPTGELTAMQQQLIELTQSAQHKTLRETGFACLLVTNSNIAETQKVTSAEPTTLIEILSSIDIIPEALRSPLYEEIFEIATKRRQVDAVREASVIALAVIPGDRAQAFNSIMGELTQGTVEAGAKALFRFPRRYWQTELAARGLEGILEIINKTPARERDTIAFKQSLRAGFELAQFLPADKAAETRQHLMTLGPAAMTLRVVPHLMLFDKTEIVVEAGKRIELTLENPGVMNHNLVVTAPGKLAIVGSLADRLIGAGKLSGKTFVPDSPDVIAASGIAPPRGQTTLAFDAPTVTGNYPFLCTIPGHWSRMNGILKVVEKNQVTASTYSNINIARTWKPTDIDHILKTRGTGTAKAGASIFTQLCSACHSVRGNGGSIGPSLTEATTRLSIRDMLLHTIAPSQRIDPEYQNYAIELAVGEPLFGRIVKQTPDTIVVVENPLDPAKPREIWRKNISSTTPSQLSTMPMGLLNTLKRRHIHDLMAYIRADK
jgi:putative membrane-bound dehydrogenase-like protein